MVDDERYLPAKPKSTRLYRIVIAGELHESWSDWLGEVDLDSRVSKLDSDTTILLSEIPDQAALRGILNRIWDLNLEIIMLDTFERGANHDSKNYCQF